MDFTVNDDLSAYTPDEIVELIAAGNEALDALFAIADPTDEQVAEAERITAAIESLRAEQASRTSRVDRMAALRDSRVEASLPPEPPEPDPEPEPQPPEVAVEEPQPQQPEPEPVQAAARETARQTLARRTTRPRVPERPEGRLTITAAADVPEFTTGGAIEDMSGVAVATINRMRGFPEVYGITDAQMQKYPVASFHVPFPDHLVIDRNSDDMEVLAEAAREARLPGGSLLAAGGWCAPSETLYDFCGGATADGLVDLPEVNAKRGGIRYTEGPKFSDIYTNVGFCQTEAQAVAGTAKTCYTVACPAFVETRLDACGICIKVPILTNAAYPELVSDVLSQSVLAHQHKMSVKAITAMVTASGSAVAVADLKSSAAGTLDAVELIANTTRQDWRLGFNETLEVVAPFWLKGAIRADLANRNGIDLLAVSDAQIDSYFTVRGVRVQYVYGWQPLVKGEEGYPTTVQIMVYPAGTFIKATNDVINLSAVYDAASLEVNEYTGLFLEEGIAIIKRCFESKLVTIPVCAAGITGAANNATCFSLTP